MNKPVDSYKTLRGLLKKEKRRILVEVPRYPEAFLYRLALLIESPGETLFLFLLSFFLFPFFLLYSIIQVILNLRIPSPPSILSSFIHGKDEPELTFNEPLGLWMNFWESLEFFWKLGIGNAFRISFSYRISKKSRKGSLILVSTISPANLYS